MKTPPQGLPLLARGISSPFQFSSAQPITYLKSTPDSLFSKARILAGSMLDCDSFGCINPAVQLAYVFKIQSDQSQTRTCAFIWWFVSLCPIWQRGSISTILNIPYLKVRRVTDQSWCVAALLESAKTLLGLWGLELLVSCLVWSWRKAVRGAFGLWSSSVRWNVPSECIWWANSSALASWLSNRVLRFGIQARRSGREYNMSATVLVSEALGRRSSDLWRPCINTFPRSFTTLLNRIMKASLSRDGLQAEWRHPTCWFAIRWEDRNMYILRRTYVPELLDDTTWPDRI